MVRGDRIDLVMIFRNLIDNAVKYANDEPRGCCPVYEPPTTAPSSRCRTTARAFRPICEPKFFADFFAPAANCNARNRAPD